MTTIHDISKFFAEGHNKIHVCPKCLDIFTTPQALENHKDSACSLDRRE